MERGKFWLIFVWLLRKKVIFYLVLTCILFGLGIIFSFILGSKGLSQLRNRRKGHAKRNCLNVYNKSRPSFWPSSAVVMNLNELNRFRHENPNLLTVLTFNIRLDTPPTALVDGEDSWQHRKLDLVEYLIQLNTKVFGLQEPQYHQVQYIADHLKEYSWFGVGSDDGLRKGEVIPIFYKTNEVELMKHGKFWLSKTPEVIGSRFEGTNLARLCTWGLFQWKSKADIKTDFYVLNTHLDYEYEWSQSLQLNVVLDFIQNDIPKETPVILMGDFNFEEESKPYTILSISSYNLCDASKAATSIVSAPTFTGFDLKEKQIIDYVWSKGLNILLYAVMVDTRPNKRQYSDHRSVLCELTHEELER